MSEINLKDLDSRISDALQKADVTDSRKILQMTDYDFLKIGNITLKDIPIIKKLAADAYLHSKPKTVLDLIKSCPEKWEKLSTGCKIFDRLLRGGVSRRGITELTGESGCGKTQLCLQLTITVQISPQKVFTDEGAVYICTEDKFPSSRLQQLFSTFPLCENVDVRKLGDNIHIEHIPDADSLKYCVSTQLPNLMKSHKIGLIVIDSITAVFRAEYDNNDMFKRAKDLRTVGLQLHSLTHQYNVSILCVNQVSSLIQSEATKTTIPVPALGLAWANLVTTRLQMIKGNENQRSLHVIFGPDLPKYYCRYQITANGIRGSG